MPARTPRRRRNSDPIDLAPRFCRGDAGPARCAPAQRLRPARLRHDLNTRDRAGFGAADRVAEPAA